MIRDDIKLEGKRVLLLPASHEHLDGLFKASNHSEIWMYSPSTINKLEDLATTMNHWMRSKEQGLRYPFVIFDKSTNEIVGSTSYLDLSPQNRKLEIGGTWLDPRSWRTSVNTECKYLLLKYGFEQLSLVRVQFRTDTRNERSNRAIQRIGAQFEGTLRQEMIMQDGYIRDSNLYSILDKEWEGVKAKLIGYLREV
ncbi:GNAT family N-acetyltransferase [Paenibacillus sp. NEAU-GSW1]|uniref:GNAT family N-acetyltransferase n=1 Tax=Paenibacillus sp. NEAU-GSW1 TaxID=2682486 RepID=UPI0012E10879|nr:GNAT family protein [Paenibacillus sp. NEAU-GSW1]MUT65873.1 GNAT family N-acetyltransferase [Paenibacillus sp. NEAU-GSW1]